MPPKKKKDKKPKKKKAVVEGTVPEDEAKGPKQPSEKSLLQARVDGLVADLVAQDRRLEELERQLEDARSRHAEEANRKLSCVEYLERTLQSKTEEWGDVQGRYRRVQDLTRLAEKRAADLSRHVDKSVQLQQGKFLQKQAELEEQLSRMEDVRLKRQKQLSDLRRGEQQLKQKTTSDRNEDRKWNLELLEDALRRRNAFSDAVDAIAGDFRDMFDATLPVHVKRQFEENVRLRRACESAGEELLEVQDRGRALKQTRKTVEVELETQGAAEGNLREQKRRLDRRVDALRRECVARPGTNREDGMKAEKKIPSSVHETVAVNIQLKIDNPPPETRQQEVDDTQADEEIATNLMIDYADSRQQQKASNSASPTGSRGAAQFSVKDATKTPSQSRSSLPSEVNCINVKVDFQQQQDDPGSSSSTRSRGVIPAERPSPTKGTTAIRETIQMQTHPSSPLPPEINQNLKLIERENHSTREEFIHLSDKFLNVLEILKDQDRYLESLSGFLERKKEVDSLMVSKILRARHVVKSRTNEVPNVNVGDNVDRELLLQIRMLLEDDEMTAKEGVEKDEFQ